MEIVALLAESVQGDSARGAGVSPAAAKRAGGTPAPHYTWHDELRRAVRDPAELVATLGLPPSLAEPARRAAASFPLFAPWPYIDRMAKGNTADPLLRQVLPLLDETANP